MHLIRFDSPANAVHRICSKGYTRAYNFRDGQLRHRQTGKEYQPQEVEIIEQHRFRRHSDTGDNTVLFVVKCQDGTKGIVMPADGPSTQLDLLLFMDQAQVRFEESPAYLM